MLVRSVSESIQYQNRSQIHTFLQACNHDGVKSKNLPSDLCVYCKQIKCLESVKDIYKWKVVVTQSEKQILVVWSVSESISVYPNSSSKVHTSLQGCNHDRP